MYRNYRVTFANGHWQDETALSEGHAREAAALVALRLFTRVVSVRPV